MSDQPPEPLDPLEPLDVARFAGPEPTRDFAAWRRLWSEDRPFPVASHRGAAGSLLVAFKRLLRPFVKAPLADLWDRQRVFNLILLEHAESHAHRVGRLEEQVQALDERAARLEVFVQEALDEALTHNDALFTRADQKLDRYRRESQDLAAALGGALAAVEASGAPAPEGASEAPAGPEEAAGTEEATAALGRALDERAYLELERRYRGTEEEIAERLEHYLPYFRDLPPERPVLDLGSGRGEALALLQRAGVPARGVDSNARMVARCRERGLEAEEGDLFAALAAAPPESLGGVVSFHVVEHLPPLEVDRLVRLAYRALAPGGLLVLETPNALSVAVSARSFWLDPTHRRPVHPQALALVYELAGFERIEHLELRPFAPAERLPEIDTAALPAEQQALADRVNRLRDRLDDLLYGFQDYALVGRKPGAGDGGRTGGDDSAVTSGA